MKESYLNLVEAERKAVVLFDAIEERGLVVPGKMESQLNTEVFELAFELFGIRKFWHKRIVRSGVNTLCPYKANPPDLELQEDDIMFFDFGPVFEEWEADYGRTYVMGNDPRKLKLKEDVDLMWEEGASFYRANKDILTGEDFYNYTKELALKFGWEYGNHHCGHLIGNFPHEHIQGEDTINYLMPENKQKMSDPDRFGNERFWIYEVHLIDKENNFGAFVERLLPVAVSK
jgi:Xaa-Pro aminopeptidase